MRSAVCFSMVWEHGRAEVSVATQYHPFNWQNALCTLPFARLATIDLLTCAVRAVHSIFGTAYMARCMRWPMHQCSQHSGWSDVRCFISSHVPLLTQSHQCCFAASGSLQVVCRTTKAVVRSSRSSWGGSCSGNPFRFLRYAFSRLFPRFPAWMVATTVW